MAARSLSPSLSPTLRFTRAKICANRHVASPQFEPRRGEREGIRREGGRERGVLVSHTLGTNGRIKENGCSKDLRLIMRLAKAKDEKEGEGREGDVHFTSPLLLRQ